MVTDFYPPGIVVGVGRFMQAKGVKSEMAGPLSRGDTLISKTFYFVNDIYYTFFN
jgi:hypothetical protein